MSFSTQQLLLPPSFELEEEEEEDEVRGGGGDIFPIHFTTTFKQNKNKTFFSS